MKINLILRNHWVIKRKVNMFGILPSLLFITNHQSWGFNFNWLGQEISLYFKNFNKTKDYESI